MGGLNVGEMVRWWGRERERERERLRGGEEGGEGGEGGYSWMRNCGAVVVGALEAGGARFCFCFCFCFVFAFVLFCLFCLFSFLFIFLFLYSFPFIHPIITENHGKSGV